MSEHENLMRALLSGENTMRTQAEATLTQKIQSNPNEIALELLNGMSVPT
jgi:hypothetical protein